MNYFNCFLSRVEGGGAIVKIWKFSWNVFQKFSCKTRKTYIAFKKLLKTTHIKRLDSRDIGHKIWKNLAKNTQDQQNRILIGCSLWMYWTNYMLPCMEQHRKCWHAHGMPWMLVVSYDFIRPRVTSRHWRWKFLPNDEIDDSHVYFAVDVVVHQ